MAFTYVDAFLVGIMLISGILALMRGFTREVLSLLSWGGAALAAYFLRPYLTETARSYFAESDKWVGDIVLVIALFVVALIIISLLTMKLSDWILDSSIGVLDRTVGFVFGLARGLWLVPREDHPQQIRNAATLPLIDATAEVIISYLPTDIAESLLSLTYSNNANAAGPVDPALGGAQDAPDAAPADGGEEGYDGGERSGLNQLLESADDAGN